MDSERRQFTERMNKMYGKERDINRNKEYQGGDTDREEVEQLVEYNILINIISNVVIIVLLILIYMKLI